MSRREIERRILQEQVATLSVVITEQGSLGITLQGLAEEAHDVGGVILKECTQSSPVSSTVPIGSRLMFIDDDDVSHASFHLVIERLQRPQRPMQLRFSPPQDIHRHHPANVSASTQLPSQSGVFNPSHLNTQHTNL